MPSAARGSEVAAVSVAPPLGCWAIQLPFGDLSKLGNAGTHLDLMLIGQNNLYRKDGGFDPEGLLGALPATVNVLAGYLAARFLKAATVVRRATIRMALVGPVLIAGALARGLAFPIATAGYWATSWIAAVSS